MATSPNTTIEIPNYRSSIHSMIHFIPSRIPSVNMPNKSQSKVLTAEEERHILDTQAASPDMKDPLQPGSSDMDERMTRDYQDAIESTIESTNVFAGDTLRQGKQPSARANFETTEEESDISWRPDPSGHPRRTF